MTNAQSGYKFKGCHYETIEEIKEAVTMVIDTLTQEDFHGAFQKLLERYNSRRRLLRRGLEFHVRTINRSAHPKKKSENLFNDPRINPGLKKCNIVAQSWESLIHRVYVLRKKLFEWRIGCWLFGFYGASTFVGYLTPSSVYMFIHLTKDFWTNT